MIRSILFSVSLLLSVLSVNNAQAAIFYVYNKSRTTIYVRPEWSGKSRSYDRLEPGQNIRYNSGIWAVSAMHWLEQIPVHQDFLSFKAFEAQVKVSFFNIGGEFNILSDGSFDYYFGVDGSGDGSATQVNNL